jgi:hypothetical protein
MRPSTEPTATGIPKARTARAVTVLAVAMALCTMRLPIARAEHATGEQGQTWASIARLPNWQGIWQLDWEHNPKLLGGGMTPGPLTAAAQAKLDRFLALQKKGENLQTQDANCLPTGMPGIMTEPYPIEFLFSPGMVVMVIETFSQVRHVYTNGEKHPADPDPAFNGHSIGHWDGDTLVVDTTNFNGQVNFYGSSKNLHVIERFRRVDANTLLYRATIDDPTTFTKSWTIEYPFRATTGPIFEYACHEGNYAMVDILGGARKEESEAKKP